MLSFRLLHILSIEPLKLIVLLEDSPIHPVTVWFDDFLRVNAMELVFALVGTAAVRAILR
jgi:hypothetical protein